MTSKVIIVSILLLLTQNTALGFIDDILRQFAQGGGHHQPAQQQRQSFPRGVPDDVSDLEERHLWLRGTTWNWNNWRDVTFEPDGKFNAPTPECQGTDACRWSAKGERIYVLWGQSGLHILRATANVAEKGTVLKGYRKHDKDKCVAKFVSKTEFEEPKDLYEILDVDPDADDKEIKKRFRKLSIKYHPDRNPSEEAALKFEEIRGAYEILSNPDKRILYDTGGIETVREAEKEEQAGGRRAMDPFAAFFGGGGGGGSRNSKRGQDSKMQFGVSLEDLYNGNTLEAKITRRVVCRGCSKRSRQNTPKCKACNRCPDEVKMVQRRMGNMIMNQQVAVKSKHKCKQEETTLEITVERGMSDGAVIKFPRMSEQTPGMIPGDVVFIVKEKPHKQFQRRGNDLEMTMKITLQEALLGFRRVVKHLDEHEFVVTNKNGISKPNQQIRIKGEGMPVHNFPSQRGDLTVILHIVFPRSLSESQKEALHSIL